MMSKPTDLICYVEWPAGARQRRMTAEEFAVLHAAWISRGRQMLDDGEVRRLLKWPPSHRSK